MSIRNSKWVTKFVFASISLIAVLMTSTHRAAAVPILVPNGGFESDVLGDGGLDSTPSDWVVVAGSLNQQGAFNPVNSQFSGTTGGTVPAPAEGNNIALINLTRSGVAGSDFSSFTSAASLLNVEDGATYEVTVAVGRRATSFIPDEYRIEMLLDDVVFAPATNSFDGSVIPADSFLDIMTSFTATAGQVGSELKVRITQSTFAGSGTFAGHFDNVRLDYTAPPVPEPSSFLLLGLGAVALVRRTRQRRRRA